VQDVLQQTLDNINKGKAPRVRTKEGFTIPGPQAEILKKIEEGLGIQVGHVINLNHAGVRHQYSVRNASITVDSMGGRCDVITMSDVLHPKEVDDEVFSKADHVPPKELHRLSGQLHNALQTGHEFSSRAAGEVDDVFGGVNVTETTHEMRELLQPKVYDNPDATRDHPLWEPLKKWANTKRRNDLQLVANEVNEKLHEHPELCEGMCSRGRHWVWVMCMNESRTQMAYRMLEALVEIDGYIMRDKSNYAPAKEASEHRIQLLVGAIEKLFGVTLHPRKPLEPEVFCGFTK